MTPPMTPERWRAVDAVLKAALSLPAPQRAAFVAEACAHDPALAREVDSLLEAHDRAGDDFLERPAAVGAPLVPPPPLGERLAAALAGHYVLEREIARGGMATVHLARDVRHQRRVAIKVLREEVAAAVGAERFLEEIRVTASLQHPHILPLFDSGSAGGLLWYVMPFVEGETLRARLERDGRLPIDVALQLAREVADALDYAHRQGVVHRDVKPENVLLQSGHALVADFGIALALAHAGGDRLTRTGITLGTPRYMAPEQATGDRPIDARTDVYALGAVLHEMLAGEPPFTAESQQAVLRRVLHEPAAALATRRADVSAALDAAVQRALAKRPDDRFPSAAAFAAALAAPVGAPTGAPDGGARPDALRAGSAIEPRPASTTRERSVSARTAMYVAGLMLALGLTAGLLVSRTPALWRLVGIPIDVVRAPTSIGLSPPLRTSAELALTIVDRWGREQRAISAVRPWTPRFSPDGGQLAYGAYGEGRESSDLWVTDLTTGATRRLTDDDGDSNDPQWSADGRSLVYSVSAPGGKDLTVRWLDGDATRALPTRDGKQFPTDWLRDGSAILVTEQGDDDGLDLVVQPTDGTPAWAYRKTPASESAARLSPDGRWIAYTSDESGRAEVYLDSYPRPGRRVTVSRDGGVHPVWRGDGRELYYWMDDALVAVPLHMSAGDGAPQVGERTTLFLAPYLAGSITMYDVSPEGQRFAIVRRR